MRTLLCLLAVLFVGLLLALSGAEARHVSVLHEPAGGRLVVRDEDAGSELFSGTVGTGASLLSYRGAELARQFDFTGSAARVLTGFQSAFPSRFAHDSNATALTEAQVELCRQLTSRLWMWVAAESSPGVIYSIAMADSSLRLECAPTLLATGDTVACALTNQSSAQAAALPLVTFNISELERGSTGARRLHLRSSSAAWLSASDEDQAVLLAVHRLLCLTELSDRARSEARKNAIRETENRMAVAILYAAVAIGMVTASWFSALWLVWHGKLFRYHATTTWTLILSVSVHGFAWMGGFGAWLTVVGAVLLNAVLSPALYLLVQWHATKRRSRAVMDSSSLAAGAAAASATSRARAEGRARACGCGPVAIMRSRPDKLTAYQVLLMAISFVLTALCVVICIIIVFAWKVNDFRVLDRRTTEGFTEFQPQLIAKTIAIMYSYEGAASSFRFDWMLQLQSRACGVFFKRKLRSESARYEKIQRSFVDKYQIDMSIYERDSYAQYDSVNDWFIRALRPDVRPLAAPGDDSVISSVADCRITVFPAIGRDERVWLKTQSFSTLLLLGRNIELASMFEGGSMVIFRLAPADYHRTHSPVSGTITHQYKIESSLYSVNADAIRSSSGAIYNERLVTVIRTAHNNQSVAFVAIGATCVGSVVMLKGVGTSVARGEEISYFQFGGSTVVALFPPRAVEFDSDLVTLTGDVIEALVRVRTRIGVWRG